MENQWLRWAKRLQSLAATGSHFSRDPFDQERYQEISQIAVAMLAGLAGDRPERIGALLPAAAEGYATPKIDVRGAVVVAGKVLLVREKSDGLWTLPGGYADVGFTPGENVEKEIREEACLDVSAYRLYLVRHKARHAYDPDVRDFYKLFFLCRPLSEFPGGLPRVEPGSETDGAEFYAPDQLPPLSTGRVLAKDIAAAVKAAGAETVSTIFD